MHKQALQKVGDAVRESSLNISRWSIDHPYPVIAFYVGIIILSVLAVGKYMPRRMMPYVESPMVGIISMMPGLSAEEMEMYISKPIEEQMVNIKGLRYLRSSSQDGFSIVSLEFPYGTDMQKALFDVQSLMNVAQSNLPATGANLKPSWVLQIDPLNLPVLSLALTGDQRWSQSQLRELADNQIVNKLKTIPNVYSVVPFGGYRRQLQVNIDRNKLAAYQLSITQIRDAIDHYNTAKPGGIITSPQNEAIVRVDNTVATADDLLNMPILTSTDSSPTQTPADSAMVPSTLYLRDVASVKDTHWETRSAFHYTHNGSLQKSIEVSIIQDPDASSPQVITGINKAIAELEQKYPGIHFNTAYDNSHFVGILFRNMFEELGIAILLTGLAVFLFLGEWRGTLISLTTIPISLAMAILMLIPLGMTLNSSTLIGLLLVIGRLVDDSIIDIHAVERHLRMGKSARDAAVDGITEVRLSVIASTIVLCLALAPLLFSGGITQQMFVGLVWPIIFGLLASMLVSFTLTSIMTAALLKPHDELTQEQSSWFYVHIMLPIQNKLEQLERGYERLIRWMLLHRFVNMARIFATIIIGFGFYYFIGSEMMPLADVGQAYGALEMQPGSSFAATEQAAERIEKIMLKHPEIEKVSTEIGAESAFESTGTYYTGYAMPSVNAATFMITLSDKSLRTKTIWQVIDSVQHEAMASIPSIRRLQIKEMGSDVMASSSAPVQLLVYGKDPQTVANLGNQVADIARKTPGMYQVATSWDMNQPDYEVKIDPVRASQVGMSVSEIADQAYYSLKGGLTSEFWRQPNLRQNTILIRYSEPDRDKVSDLAHTYITTPDGRQVPLNSLASITYRQAPSLIEHDGLRRVVNVMGFYRPGSRPSMDLSMDIQMQATQKLNFPPGYGIEMRGDMTQMMDSFRRLLIGLMLAVIFIYLILVAQFRGFLQPLQMIFSLPLELSGVFLFLFLMHQAFSTVSILGIIVLTGMDITTAILLIDLIVKYRENGVPRDEAVATACPQRIRPILMTAMITIIAMSPVAFFPKTGMDAYSPLATTVIGGLVVGTILSLLDIPILHTYADDFIQRLGQLRRKKQDNADGMPTATSDHNPEDN